MQNLGEAAAVGSRPTPEEIAAQVQLFIASPPFQNAELTRRLLLFLADWSIHHPDQSVKEIEIAGSVFDRHAEQFDSKLDSTVRVQVGRLRAKLMEYYVHHGGNDLVEIDIPKGAYCLASTYRKIAAAADPGMDSAAVALPAPPADELPAPPPASRGFQYLALGAAALLGILVGATGMWRWSVAPAADLPPGVRQFWSVFTRDPMRVLLVFSNPRLAGTLSTEGLHYYDEEVDSKTPGAQNLTYAGSGDIPATFELTRLFDNFRRPFEVRSGALLSWGEASSDNLIFIGRPEQNPALHEIPRLREFYFKYGLGIVNAHPAPGERATYAANKRPYTIDHAVVALVPGAQPGRHCLILAGTTTYGSQAAASFVTSGPHIEELLRKLGVKPSDPMPTFEALIQVQIRNEVPVWSKLLDARRRVESPASWERSGSDER